MREPAVRREDAIEAPRWLGVVVTALVLAAAGLGSLGARTVVDGDAYSVGALRRVAITFNRDYAANHDGPVYDRFDGASRAVITRGAYLRRHRECPTSPGSASVTTITRRGEWWEVEYVIDGVILHDFWRYELGRWSFDLARSNPDAVALYRLPFAAYARAVGCSPGG